MSAHFEENPDPELVNIVTLAVLGSWHLGPHAVAKGIAGMIAGGVVKPAKQEIDRLRAQVAELEQKLADSKFELRA